MNVSLINPISITVNSAKLVVEDDSRGTIEFTILDQPVRLNIESSDYVYNTNISVDDRVKLIENYGALKVDSEGTVKEIIVSATEDHAKVLFDYIIPDQTLEPVEVHIISASASILIDLPLRVIEKI
jgi:hypothetical protein